MGIEIDREYFTKTDYRLFSEKLQQNLSDLENLLQRPDFGTGPGSLGAELEVSTVDGAGKPVLLCQKLLTPESDPRLQSEINCFNLEFNLTPVPLKGRPFSALEEEMNECLSDLDRKASPFGGRVATIGILPTLGRRDLLPGAMTDSPRYLVLSSQIRRMREKPFNIRIDGPEPLAIVFDDVTTEGANNSFQVHLRVDPTHFAATYNAAQLVTAPVLALSANSPFFLGHSLWDETRVPLFKQAVDTRGSEEDKRQRPARVFFGSGWVRKGALELFIESVALFPPLLPLIEAGNRVASDQDVPSLRELRLHLGSVWYWNRPIYDSCEGGHLRIELRALPTGPTPRDMTASAAFLVGATVGMRSRMEKILPAFPFWCAESNFYRAARSGLESRLLWPSFNWSPPRERPATEIVEELLPIAEDGLAELGVDRGEIRLLMEIVRGRLENRITGARWQRNIVSRLEEAGLSREDALAEMFRIYSREAAKGMPLHEWRTEP